jgi:hypothetical protein
MHMTLKGLRRVPPERHQRPAADAGCRSCSFVPESLSLGTAIDA